MSLPILDNQSAKKPLGYNPLSERFLYYSDIISGREKIVYPISLSQSDKKMLIIERLKKGPDFTMQSISGNPYTRNDIIKAVNDNDEVGIMTLEAEISMLNDLLTKISENI